MGVLTSHHAPFPVFPRACVSKGGVIIFRTLQHSCMCICMRWKWQMTAESSRGKSLICSSQESKLHPALQPLKDSYYRWQKKKKKSYQRGFCLVWGGIWKRSSGRKCTLTTQRRKRNKRIRNRLNNLPVFIIIPHKKSSGRLLAWQSRADCFLGVRYMLCDVNWLSAIAPQHSLFIPEGLY